MKKLMSIITMLLVVIGISGCGSSVPTEVTVEPGKMTTLVVGEDIAPGNYTHNTSGIDGVQFVLTTQGTLTYDLIKQQNKLYGDQAELLPETINLTEGDILFLDPVEIVGEVTLKKE